MRPSPRAVVTNTPNFSTRVIFADKTSLPVGASPAGVACPSALHSEPSKRGSTTLTRNRSPTETRILPFSSSNSPRGMRPSLGMPTSMNTYSPAICITVASMTSPFVKRRRARSLPPSVVIRDAKLSVAMGGSLPSPGDCTTLVEAGRRRKARFLAPIRKAALEFSRPPQSRWRRVLPRRDDRCPSPSLQERGALELQQRTLLWRAVPVTRRRTLRPAGEESHLTDAGRRSPASRGLLYETIREYARAIFSARNLGDEFESVCFRNLRGRQLATSCWLCFRGHHV